jgi:hypothetical protein
MTISHEGGRIGLQMSYAPGPGRAPGSGRPESGRVAPSAEDLGDVTDSTGGPLSRNFSRRV